MLKPYSSFRSKLFSSFIALILLAMFITFILMRLMHNLEQSRSIQIEIIQLKLHMVEILEEDKEFLNENYLDSEYYKSGYSSYLNNRERSILNLNDHLDSIKISSSLSKNDKHELLKVRNLIFDYDNTFRKLCKKQLIRGFKDYGIEGKMRSFAHQLENYNELRFTSDVLTLRRHEKDYFLRGDSEYVKKLNLLISDLLIRLDSIGSAKAKSEQQLLINYQEAFNHIVSLERDMGLNSSDGLKHELEYYSDSVKFSLGELVSSISSETKKDKDDTVIIIISVVVLGIVISILAIIFLANSISRPVVSITKKMRDFNLEFANKILLSDFRRKEISSEMVVMMRAYNKMVHQIQQQVRRIETQNHELGLKNENLNSLNKELDRFAFSVSHDLRSPITSILGLINLVKIENPQLIEVAYLHHIEECVAKLNKFIENLLHYSKNAQEQVSSEKTDLRALIESFQKTHLTDRIKNLEIIIETDGQAIVSDSFRLEIILQNILANCIRYRDLTKPKHTISITQKKSNKTTSITIEDNGIGIDQSEVEKVFDLFYKSKLSEDGTGLGLFIVKKTLERIGGKIDLKSELGKGTKVSLTIPDLDGNSQKNSSYSNSEFLDVSA